MKPIYKLLLVAVIAMFVPQPGFALFPHIHLPHLHVPLPHLHRAKKSPTPSQNTSGSETTNQNGTETQGENAPAADQNAPAAEQNAPAEEQNPPAATPVTLTGPTAFGQVVGMRSNLGTVYNAGVGVGYNISNNFGGDIGFTIYTVQSPFSIVTNKDWRWTTLVGDPFVDFRYAKKISGLNFTSVLTGTIPVSSPERVFTTGRFGVDLFNHVEGHIMNLTPFVNFGAANESMDRYIFPRPYNIARPYQTFGFMGDFEGGATYTILKHYKIGGSAYAIVPAGTQKMFSRLVNPDSTVSGDESHYRYFNHSFETVGDSSIDRDNGYSGWFDVNRFQNLTVEFGYTYSNHYKLGSAYIMLRYDGTALIRFLTATE